MIDRFKQHLRESGAKVTGPRLDVFRFLEERHLTTVAEVVSNCGGVADRASIYRTLKLFRELGVIHDIVVAGRRMIELTDTYASHHHHLSCLRCGRSEVVADRGLEEDMDRIASGKGFRQVSHQVEISGICAACQKKQGA